MRWQKQSFNIKTKRDDKNKVLIAVLGSELVKILISLKEDMEQKCTVKKYENIYVEAYSSMHKKKKM